MSDWIGIALIVLFFVGGCVTESLVKRSQDLSMIRDGYEKCTKEHLITWCPDETNQS